MTQYVSTPTKTFEADEAIAVNLRVKLDADGKVTIAGALDREIGTAVTPAYAAGDEIAVRLASAQGTGIYVANAAIAVGAACYGAAGGEVDDAAANVNPVGVAMHAAAADAEVEVLRVANLPTT